MYNHEARFLPDDGGPIIYRWHFPRHTFEKRMSAYEIASFVLPHMPSISPLLAHHPRVKAEWDAMLVMLATSPREVIDRIVPWIKPLIRTDENDILEMNLFAPEIDDGPKYFVMGAA